MSETQFPGVKPMPGVPAAGRTVARDDNRPPLDETIVIEFGEAIEPLQKRIADLLAAADRAAPINEGDDITLGKYGEAVKMIDTAFAKVDAAREEIKRPYLLATRALDGRANGIKDSLLDAKAKIKKHTDDFVRREDAKRKAEHDRNMAEQRRLQAEAAAEAEKERQRLQAIADADAAKERERLQVLEDERAAAAGREAAKVIVKAEVVEVEPEPVYVAPVETEKFVARSDLGVRVGVKEEWDCEVENIRQVPDLYLKRVSVIEALTKEIKRDVRGKNGVREIKGVRIWSTVGSSIR